MYTQTRLSLLIWVALLLLSMVTADTEIRNFRLPSDTPIKPFDQVGPTDILNSSSRKLRLVFDSKSVYRTIALQISEEDEGYSRWTVRLSWPGSSPTAFDLQVRQLGQEAHLSITASPLSPRISSLPTDHVLDSLLRPLLGPPAGIIAANEEWNTTALLVFEPLVLGAIPRTALRTIAIILAFASGAAVSVPPIIRAIEGSLQEATPPVNTKATPKKTQ